MPAGNAKDWIYLVDAHSLIFQVFHAIRPPMTSPSGLPIEPPSSGFTRDLLFLRPEEAALFDLRASDRSEPTFRSDIYPEYKAHREPMPSDLELQIPLIHQVLEAMAIPVVSHVRLLRRMMFSPPWPSPRAAAQL